MATLKAAEGRLEAENDAMRTEMAQVRASEVRLVEENDEIR